MLHGEEVAFCGRCGEVLANLQGKGSAGPFSMSHYVEGLKKTFYQMLGIASDNVARVSLVPVNLNIVSLILCRSVASTSGAHFI